MDNKSTCVYAVIPNMVMLMSHNEQRGKNNPCIKTKSISINLSSKMCFCLPQPLWVQINKTNMYCDKKLFLIIGLYLLAERDMAAVQVSKDTPAAVTGQLIVLLKQYMNTKYY